MRFTAELTEAIRQRLGVLFLNPVKGDGPPTIDFTTGDAGLFGPKSVTWRLHADYPSMLIGGVSAILLQALHPLAMAGVYDHSNFREDPYGRLRRTATFLAGTTYAETARALSLIQMVRKIHQRVVGTAPDGRPYAASDPALLTWIHTAEAWSFLQGYQRYAKTPLSKIEQDHYLAELAQIAERLGAERVPKSVREAKEYFAKMRPSLVYGAQAKEAIQFLRKTPAPHWAIGIGFHVIFEAAVDLLPDWARELLGERRPLHVKLFRPALLAGCSLIRWATSGSTVVELAEARIKNSR